MWHMEVLEKLPRAGQGPNKAEVRVCVLIPQAFIVCWAVPGAGDPAEDFLPSMAHNQI